MSKGPQTASRITIDIEYPSTDELNGPIIDYALRFIRLIGDKLPSDQWHLVPGSQKEEYQQVVRGPTRFRWHAEHALIPTE